MKKTKKTGKKIGSQKLAKKKVGKTEKKKKLAKNWLAILANFPTSVVLQHSSLIAKLAISSGLVVTV